MTTSTETYQMACTFKAETDRAVLIVDHASGEELWIPLSQVEEMHRTPTQEGSITMTAWIAKRKGLI